MKGMPSAPSQKSIALCLVEPTMVMWCSPWTWIFFVTDSPFRQSVLQRRQFAFQPSDDLPHGLGLGVGHGHAEAGNQRALARVAGADDAAGEAGRAEEGTDAQLRAAEAVLDRQRGDLAHRVDVAGE